MRPKNGFNLSTLRNTFQPLLLLKFHYALNNFIKFFLRPWCASTQFHSKRVRYSVHLNDSSMGDFSERCNFFTDKTKKVVLTNLRLETGSNIFYFWSFTMHSITWSNLFCGYGTLLLHFTQRGQNNLFMSVIYPRGILWRQAIFSHMRPRKWFQPVHVLKQVPTFTISEISPCTQYLHQVSLRGRGAFLLRFTLKVQDTLFILVIHTWGIIWKEAISSEMRPKMWV